MENENIIQIPTENDYHLLCKHVNDNKDTIMIFMTHITIEEEIEIDNRHTIKIERGNKVFEINPNRGDIYCYGIVDFNTDSSDYNIIDNFNFLKHLNIVGIKIQSRYNYENHTCDSPKEFPLWTETWSPAELAQLAHGYLGKPERIVLFKQVKHK